MKQDKSIYRIADKEVRTTIIDGENYVALDDFCACLEDAIRNIGELTRVYENRVANLRNMLDTLTETLGRKHPEVLEELNRAKDPSRWN